MKTMNSATVAVVAACLAGGCSSAKAIEAKPARPVRTQTVTMAPPPAGIRYSATIESFEKISLAFKTSGYVNELARRPGADGKLRAAQAGDRVTKGTVLARVDEADYRERVNQGRAKLAESEANLKKARLDLDRAETLFTSASLTKPDLDNAQAAFESAHARVSSAQADIEVALNALRDCAIVAPATGVLLERRIEVGTLVGAGSVAYLLGDVSSVKARFGVPDSAIELVKLGESIRITVDAINGATFEGRVTALAPAADAQSRVFDVEVTIPNADGRLRPGMIGTVAIGHAAAAAAPGLTVPLGAIVKGAPDTPGYAVLVVERDGAADVARMRPVELGEVTGNGVSVLKGVAAGERVIVSGASLLNNGDKVRIIPMSDPR